MIKIITDRADNGNRFLCEDCGHGLIRSGLSTEKEIFCTNADLPTGKGGEIKFVVTQCSGYFRKDPRTTKQYKVMETEAYFLVSSKEGRGMVFVEPAEYKRRKAAHEEW